MKNFTYYRPKTAQAAVALLDAKWGTTELLAGGTDLHDLQKDYIAQPDKVVSLADLTDPRISAIEQTRAGVRIGAAVKVSDLAANERVKSGFPGLATAAREMGTPQIRNMATVGGNLCQRNRCWYFRDEHVHCLLKGGDKCFALGGENRYHAVFSKGHKCVIVNPSTLAPVLIALDARAEVMGPTSAFRSVKLAEFFRAPGGPSDREHVLAPNEMVLSVMIPFSSDGLKSASYEVRHKQSYDWPLVQAAVAFHYEGGKATDVRVVLGHVAPTPLVSPDAAKAIDGKALTEETAAAAGAAAAKGASPLSQNEYKVKLIAVAVKRALLTAAGAKKYWEA
jgi:xanthine dehydrogenase YagS FAD-binding subunit